MLLIVFCFGTGIGIAHCFCFGRGIRGDHVVFFLGGDPCC